MIKIGGSMKKLKNILVGIIGIIYFVFVIINTILMLNINKYGVTQFDDMTLVVIKSEISSNNYIKGDLVVVRKPKFENIQVGDELFIYKIKKDGSPVIDLGIVGEIHEKDESLSFENGASYEMDYVIGGSEKVYHEIGKYFSIIQSQWGFLFIILVPSFLIFVYELYAIIVEVKYGKPDAKK